MAGEKRHLQRVFDWGYQNGCVVCQAPMAHVHHILEDRVPGRKSSDWLTIPLCLECHTGTHGIHGDRQLWRLHKMSETQALAKTLEGLFGDLR